MGKDPDFYQCFPGALQFIRPGQPLYIQLADVFRPQIELGKLPAGSRLPNLLEMAAHFDVARVTVRQAVQMLVSEGYPTSRQGSACCHYPAAEKLSIHAHIMAKSCEKN